MGRFRPGRNSGAARNRARCSGCSCLTWSMLSIDWSWTAGILGHASSLLAGEPAAREGEYVNLFLRVLEQEFRQRQQPRRKALEQLRRPSWRWLKYLKEAGSFGKKL